VRNVTQTTYSSFARPCLQHNSTLSSSFTQHYGGHLWSFLEDPGSTVVYYLLKSSAVEIQQCSQKVSHESISIIITVTTLQDSHLELQPLSLLFHKGASFSFFSSPFTVKLQVKGGLTALRLKVYKDRALHTHKANKTCSYVRNTTYTGDTFLVAPASSLVINCFFSMSVAALSSFAHRKPWQQ